MANKTVRVPIHRTTPTQTVSVEVGATKGAQIGLNLLLDDGTLATTAKLQALFGSTGASTGTGPDTTDALDEGKYNLYFTRRRAQDAVGDILADSATITLDYVAGTSIKATLNDLADSGTGTFKLIDRDAKGRAIGTRDGTSDDVPEGSANFYSHTYIHTQASPSATWTINHNLGFKPSISLITDGGAEFVADVSHASVNTTIVTLSSALSGAARCN